MISGSRNERGIIKKGMLHVPHIYSVCVCHIHKYTCFDLYRNAEYLIRGENVTNKQFQMLMQGMFFDIGPVSFDFK